ncbi:MAG: SIMPL domain-containing protein [Verrucomicrobiota bacterium]
MKAILLTLLGGALVASANASEIVVVEKDPDDVVTISATGKSERMAGGANITLRLKTESSTLREGISRNQEAQRNLVDYLVAKGIPRSDIKTEKFSSVPQHGKIVNRVKSYDVLTTIEVKVSSEKHFLVVAERIDEVKEIELIGHEIDYDDAEEVSTQASMDALANLKVKREAYEQALGIRLETVSLSESGLRVVKGRNQGAVVYEAALSRAKASAAHNYAGPPHFGKISASLTLNAKFRIKRDGVNEVARVR